MAQFMDEVVQMAEEFRSVMGQKLSPLLAANLVREEGEEMWEAMQDVRATPCVETIAAFLKEEADYLYTSGGMANVMNKLTVADPSVDLDEAFGLDSEFSAMLDTLSMVASDAEYFIPHVLITTAVRRVHSSNMSKMGPNGEITRNAAGKVCKGEFYFAPDLTDLAEIAFGLYNAYTGKPKNAFQKARLH
jgi:hypothetical protein